MRILMICVKKLDKGGIETYVMSLFRHFNHGKIEVDFLVHSNEVGCLEEEIKSYGSKIYKLPRLGKNPIKYVKELSRILRDGDYDVVHRHATASIMWVDLALAKRAGIKRRIAHSHSTDWSHRIIHKMGIPILNYVSTDRFACSKKAGEWMFNKKNFIVMKNGIDENLFAFNRDIRNQYRKKFGWEEKYVIINVARCGPEKNQKWLIEMAKGLKNINVTFVIVGDGPLFDDLKTKVNDLRLGQTVLLLGSRDDISSLLISSDMFILPSIFEGLPISMIEAQCTGIPCIGSANITDEVILSESVKLLDLNFTSWQEYIKENIYKTYDRSFGQDVIINHHYSIKQTAKQMEDFYLNENSNSNDVHI